MRVFLTGATGFIGSHILPELLAAGHSVLGLTRSAAGVNRLKAAGAEAHLGTLEDLDSLAKGADAADAVIHTAFDHDFSRFAENCEKDRRVVTAIGTALIGSDRPLIVTSGVGLGFQGPGLPAVEHVLDRHHGNPRIASEEAVSDLLDRGVSVATMRLPQVHDTRRQGLISPLIDRAREMGVSPYVGDGANQWSAGSVIDVAKLYRLALDHHETGARYNAVVEEGVAMRDIATVVGEGLGVPVRSITPEEAKDHFGWMAWFAAQDMRASSAWTRAHLNWQPSGPQLLDDLRNMDYAASFAH